MTSSIPGPDLLGLSPDHRGGARAVVLAALLVVSGLSAASPAAGELVVLAHGDVMKVPSYRLEGDEAVLTLEAGGTVRLPLSLIARVVDDEIVPAAAVDEPLPEPPVPLAFHPDQPAPVTPFGEEIYAAARRHGVNPEIVAAMARAESAFDPTAVSRAGARGLMQLMPATAERFGVPEAQLFDPERNLEAGVAYLRWLITRFDGDLTLVLAAYNAGEQVVERYGGVPPYRETIGYVERVSGYLGL